MVVIFTRIRDFFLRFRLKAAAARHRRNPGEKEITTLARVLLKQSRGDEAFKLIHEGRRLFPASKAIREVYSLALRRRASDLLVKTTEELKVQQTPLRFMKAAQLCRALGDFEEAFAYAYEGKRLFPDDPGILVCIGKLYFYRYCTTGHDTDIGECLKQLRRAIELNPQDAKALFFLALALGRMGAAAEALRVADSILELNPDDPKAVSLKNSLAAAASLAASEGRRAPRGEAPAERPVMARLDAAGLVRERIEACQGFLGYFFLDSSGSVIDSSAQSNPVFDFHEPVEGLRAMASSCHFDSTRIGVGNLLACTIIGERWRIALRPLDENTFIGFFDESATEQAIDELFAAPPSRVEMACEASHA